MVDEKNRPKAGEGVEKILLKPSNERNRSLDVLKGVCIVFIVITHFAWRDEERLQYGFPFWIDMAVPIFMCISGYVNGLSLQKRQIGAFSQAYAVPELVRKLLRFTVPFLIVFVAEEIWLGLDGKLSLGAWQTVLRFLQGGTGVGSYYYPILVQFVFVFPIIYAIIRRHDLKGLILCTGVNFFYELLQTAYQFNGASYRLLVFRYIFVIAFGCYLAIGKKQVPFIAYVISFVVGVLFIVLVCYGNYQPYVLTQWTRTSFVASFYIVPICALLIKRVRISFLPLEWLGKASYHIFLVQMLYYNEAYRLYAAVDGRLLELLLSVALCLVAGVLFYYAETPVTNNLQKAIFKRIG